MIRAIVFALTLSSAAPAFAAPASGNVGLLYKPVSPEIYGVEAELGPAAGPWSVGALYQAEYFSSSNAWNAPMEATTWFRWRVPMGEEDDAGALVGFNASYVTPNIGQSAADSWSTGPVLGLFYTMRSGRLWLRATPHAVIAPYPNNLSALLSHSGIPWLEAGIQVAPHLQVSFRLTEAFLKVAYTFD